MNASIVTVVIHHTGRKFPVITSINALAANEYAYSSPRLYFFISVRILKKKKYSIMMFPATCISGIMNIVISTPPNNRNTAITNNSGHIF